LLPLAVFLVIGCMVQDCVGMCGPILVVNLLHVWTVCHAVKRLIDRNEDKPA